MRHAAKPAKTMSAGGPCNHSMHDQYQQKTAISARARDKYNLHLDCSHMYGMLTVMEVAHTHCFGHSIVSSTAFTSLHVIASNVQHSTVSTAQPPAFRTLANAC
eukprot:jgi/Ulvmu1/5996/UM026_0120.1